MDTRADFRKCRRVTVKIGSRVICNDQGLAYDRLRALSGQVDLLRRRGMEVILVSSGAVAAGRRKLKGPAGRLTIQMKQACAAAGQVALMTAWEKALSAHDHRAAQILLTADDLADRHRFIHAKNTLVTLLELKAIPVVNENDTVALDELKFGDNDTLGSLVASLAESDLFVNLSDIDGFFESDPRTGAGPQLIRQVDRVSPAVLAKAGAREGSEDGTGGMFTKVRAAGRLAERGMASVIANGLTRDVLPRLMDGEDLGTFFRPSGRPRRARKHWLAFAARPKGRLFVDAGAAKAITEQGKSLLPKGVRGLQGLFAAGDAVNIMSQEGESLLGVGLVNYPSPELTRIMGLASHEIEGILGFCHSEEVIHRDNLVIYDKPAA
ncbi:MAG: glutamate 5-kinase [Deltaproteobacteria bacterium]|jgi:glutamate 5-kinase|nr:glutamate 5-kinase [Deltaproteobacteria bacterium]